MSLTWYKYIYYNGVKWRKVVWRNISIHTNSYISYLWLKSMAAVNGAQGQGIPRISWNFLNAGKIFYDKSYLWLGTTAAVTGAKRPRTAQILRGRVETCFYYQVSCGLLVSCAIEGVTEGHRRSMAITTGAKRRVFVTNRGRDWSEATPIPER